MAFQPSADSFGIRRLGFKCSRGHRRQVNDAVALNEVYLAKISMIKLFPCRDEHVRTYILVSRYAWWQKTTNRHTHGTTTVTLAAHARRGLIIGVKFGGMLVKLPIRQIYFLDNISGYTVIYIYSCV